MEAWPAFRPAGKLEHDPPEASSFSSSFAGRRPIPTDDKRRSSVPFVSQFSGALPVVSLFDGLDAAGRSDFSAGTGGGAPAADRAVQSVDQRLRHRAGGRGAGNGSRG